MELEPQTPSPPPPPPPASSLSSSTVDTSRAFSSVKEAVAVFGQKLLAQEIIHSSSPNYQIWKISPKPSPAKKNDHESQDDQNTLVSSLKRLEAELEATKTDLKLLKEREEETEVAVASLNAELHKNMSKIARAEAVAAGKAAVLVRTEGLREIKEKRMEEEEEQLRPTLAQILGGGERNKEKKAVKNKKKPIVPLVCELFPRRKGSSTTTTTSLHDTLFI